MPTAYTYLPYSETGYFSHLVIDYLNADPRLSNFYTFSPNEEGIKAAIQQRENYPINRKVLVEVINKQYKNLIKPARLEKNIDLLLSENTFTVCTAHQPNLLTGYLYFIYKIIHAIKLAEDLKLQYPEKNFVPVYYMGSEDNDLEELGKFRYNGNKYVWDGDGQSGAVGQMKTAGLKPLLNELFNLFGPPGDNCDVLKNMLSKAYLQHDTISEATQYLVNELFGNYGLVVLNPDDAALKEIIIPIMEDDLFNQTALRIVSDQVENLSVVQYKAQAFPRPINLFYLNTQLRERIERKDNKWKVINSNIEWDKEALLMELHEHPERFSPNVILRGLFQESILPNIVFIGGGSEVAYWFQLKTLFSHYNVFYPCIQLRQSVLWIEPALSKLRTQLQLTINDIFKQELELIRFYINENGTDDWHTTEEATAVENILNQLKQKATALDPTLRASAEAALTKIRRQLQTLEKKMLRAEKKKMQTQLLKIDKLKSQLFPQNTLQERIENFSDYFLHYGYSYFDILKDAMKPLKPPAFLIIENNG